MAEIWKETVLPKWLTRGVITEVELADCQVVSPLYLKREETKYRPIWDGRYVNQYI